MVQDLGSSNLSTRMATYPLSDSMQVPLQHSIDCSHNGFNWLSMDARIAAIAMFRRLILLTRNHRDFSKVTGLLIEDRTV
jgi:hypothetical protein